MPEIGRIQSTNFQALLTDLGITRNQIPFGLQSEVMPVVLVGGTVSFLASPTPAYRVVDIFTVGALVAPVAGTVLADTGPLPIGGYSMSFVVAARELNNFDIEWRDSINISTLATISFAHDALTSGTLTWLSRFQIENDNERVRIINVVNGGVGITYQASILARI